MAAKRYEWVNSYGEDCVIETDGKDQWIKHQGIFVDEVFDNRLILKTSKGTEIQLETQELKIYEVME